MKDINGKRYLTTHEVAERWKGFVTAGRLQKWRERGTPNTPAPTKIGGVVYYRLTEIRRQEIEWDSQDEN